MTDSSVDPHAEEKALWVQAKRAVLAILRVQPAKDLVECLMQSILMDAVQCKSARSVIVPTCSGHSEELL